MCGLSRQVLSHGSGLLRQVLLHWIRQQATTVTLLLTPLLYSMLSLAPGTKFVMAVIE